MFRISLNFTKQLMLLVTLLIIVEGAALVGAGMYHSRREGAHFRKLMVSELAALHGENIVTPKKGISDLKGEEGDGKSTGTAGTPSALNEAAKPRMETGITEALQRLDSGLEGLARRRFVVNLILVAGCMLLSCGIAFYFARVQASPLRHAARLQKQMSKGDFSGKLEISSTNGNPKNEMHAVLSGMNDLMEIFRKMLGQVQRSGIKVASSITELSATAKQQQATVDAQVKSIQQVANSTQDISDITSELVKTIKQVTGMLNETVTFAGSGQEGLARMQGAMGEMESASSEISAHLEGIHEKAENITTVVTTITKVADQTNLLSLNAAIEAEKAGEYGRGFAVVASEIRRLADQTAVATLDIEQMVEEMQAAVTSGVNGMEKFIADVRQNVRDVETISQQLNRIIAQVQGLLPSFEDINEGMEFQAGNAQEISETMLRLQAEMQETMSSLNESFFAIDELNEGARGLQMEVSQFKGV